MSSIERSHNKYSVSVCCYIFISGRGNLTLRSCFLAGVKKLSAVRCMDYKEGVRHIINIAIETPL